MKKFSGRWALGGMVIVALVVVGGVVRQHNIKNQQASLFTIQRTQTPQQSSQQCALTITALPTPASQSVSVGTNQFDFAHIQFSASAGCAITLNKVVVGVNNNVSNVSAMIQNLNVYNLATGAQVGSTITSPTWANNVGSNLGIQIPAGGSVVFVLKADVVGTGSHVIQFGESYTEAVQTGTTTQVGNGYQYWGQWMKIVPRITNACVNPMGAYQYVTKWGAAGNGNGQLAQPNGIVTDSSGNMYVVDSGNNRIEKFSPSGAYLTQLGTYGSGNGQFSDPNNIALDPLGDIYVTDSSNNRVEKFSPSGVYLSQFGTYGSGNGQFKIPAGIAINSSGNIYVTDVDNSRVEEFSPSGIYLGQWGHLSIPEGIAVDSSGNVYVANYGLDTIVKFTPSGNYITRFGTYGSGNGQFDGPDVVSIDPSGNIYVGEERNNRIQKFTPSGNYITQFGTYGSGNGQFHDPDGVVADSYGNAYVVDATNNRIEKFVSACE